MKMTIEFYLLFVLVVKCQGVLYNLNETQYRSMPTLFTMDDFNDCNIDPHAIYCVADFDLFSETESELMNIIKEYSSHTIKHFNYTQVHRAVCLSKTCKNYYQYKFNNTMKLNATLEACINQSIWLDYGLEAKIAKLHYCKYKESSTELDSSDIIVAVVYALIILLISIGSLYDVYRSKNNTRRGNAYLLAFSLKRNWNKLTAPAGIGVDSRLKRLKVINGMRAMTMICVIFSHTTILLSVFFIANPLYVEKAFDDLSKQILLNGSLVVHTFFVMSSFLLAYNLQIYAESHKIVWTQIPKGIFLRWLRLTPPYALIIATISTWMRHVGDGPLWQMVVTSESEKCRQYWWANIFYFNNYILRDDRCFIQGWYLAADLQLFCLGLALLVLIKSSRGRKTALSLLFLLSLMISAAHTYFDDLNAVVMQSPEILRSLYINERTFLLVYIRGYTNLSTYTMGLAGGLITYYWQNKKLDLSKYKKYRWIVWIEFPLAVGIILSGGLFYIDGFELSTWAKVLYATFYKPIFQALVASFMVFSIFKLDSVYRGIVEWRGFTWAGRVSYSAYLLHFIFQRGYIGTQITPIYLTDYNVLVFLCASVFLSFLGGAVLWLTVEAPVAALIRAMSTPDKNDK